jgi:hypothetical protein
MNALLLAQRHRPVKHGLIEGEHSHRSEELRERDSVRLG